MALRFNAAVGLGVFATCVMAGATDAAAQRLPTSVVPSHYAVTWTPDLASARFTGVEQIDVTVAQATREVVLNALELEIQDVRVTQDGSGQTARVSLDPAAQQASLTVDEALRPGHARIELRFSGTLNDTLAGLYRSRTATRTYAVTQFEATDARRAFPCFDEPALKATFDIAAVVATGDMAISNMPIASDDPGPGPATHTVRFQTTRRLPTYLVALLVGDFECAEGSQDGIPLRVCATPGHAKETGFALEATRAVLSYYHRYYGMPLPFPKLDQIAVPDFMAGAMENAGAIVYRETELLVNERTADEDQRNGIASVIAHEIAHQWFGDLVTMAWWDDVWLNEGFATWMSSKPLAEWKPSWELPLQDVQETGYALSADAVASTRAIQADRANTPAEIQQLFDGISYGKAAAVLRMLEQYLGPDVFQRGVNAYLARHAWKNATADDFWKTLAETSGKPVDTIMRGFVTQPGAPLVDVSSTCESGQQQVSLATRRFYADPARLAAGSPERWTIPVCLRRPGEDARCELVSGERRVVRLQGCAPWLLAKADGRGYYRVHYAPALASSLGHAAAELSPAERISFLQDQWQLTSVGQETVPAYLGLVGGLGPLATDRVMQTAWGPFEYIGREIVARADRPAWQAWVRALAQPYLDRVGAEPGPDDTPDMLRTRARVLRALAIEGRDPNAIARLRAVMDRYLEDPASVQPSLVDPAVRSSTRFGDKALFDRMVRVIDATASPDVRSTLEYALVNFEDPVLIQRALDRLLTPAVRNQDMLFILLRAMRGPDTREMAWRFIKSHLPEVQARSGSLSSTAVVAAAGEVCDPALEEDVRAFFAAHPIEGAEVTLQQELERADECIRLVRTERPGLSAWLATGAPTH